MTEVCCFHCNHRVFSCVDYVANNERGVGLFGIVRSSAEALTTRPANEGLCVWSSCLHVCMCVCVRFALRYHYALLYQGFSVEQVIFLDISSCSEPEMRAMQILRERERAFGQTLTLTLLL